MQLPYYIIRHPYENVRNFQIVRVEKESDKRLSGKSLNFFNSGDIYEYNAYLSPSQALLKFQDIESAIIVLSNIEGLIKRQDQDLKKLIKDMEE